MRRKTIAFFLAMGFAIAFASTTLAAPQEEKRFGGHFGFVIPLITEVDGETTTVDEDFLIGFPMGLNVKLTDRIAFDLEIVPIIQDTPQQIELVIHPGAIFKVGSYAVGVRLALEIESDAWGFTPLVARGFPIGKTGINYFVELDFPVRFLPSDDTAVTFAIHSGISF